MELDFVKKFLRIDYDDDDEYIKFLIEAAKEYIKDAVGKYNEKSFRCRLLALTLISSMYDTRTYTITEGTRSSEKVRYAIKSMVLQLQLEEDSNNE